ncbi:hypothetical protein V7S43_008849 [Phytophthora oleae]|uniref:Uncharacterized protein n=1 Tax=Phytophthora oleae TaxID=2107226 RepID=A0ABD3FH13_9STRA
MSLSDRQQTLLSIYGAPNDGKKKLLKPQRPKSRTVLRKSGPRRPAPFAHRENKGSSSEAAENNKKIDQERVAIAPQILLSPPSEGCRSPVDDEKAAPSFVRADPAAPRESLRRTVGASATKGANGESTVISLYGDAFLEIPLSDTSKGSERTEPSRLLGNCGFLISMLLFKAADTEKSKAKL